MVVAKGPCRVWLEAARGAVNVIGSAWKASRRRRCATFALCLNRLLPRDLAGAVMMNVI